MSVISLLVVLALIGLVAWALVRFVPMPPGMQTLIYVAAVLIGIIYLLSATGILSGVSTVAVPRIK